MIGQQVADRMVVLAVRQPTHRQRLVAKLLGALDPAPRLTHLFLRQTGQVADPAEQHLFLVTTRFDPLTARVFLTVCGHQEQ